jgi:hypothetical protein
MTISRSYTVPEGRRRSGPADGRTPDGRRGGRPGRRPDDQGRRPLAGRLRLLQLPRSRPRPRGPGRHPRLSGPLGDPPQLGPRDRQPGLVRAGGGRGRRPARGRGRARLPDPDPHPQRRPPGPGQRGHAADRRPCPPDHPRCGRGRQGPRRLGAPDPPGRRAARRTAAAWAGAAAEGDLHGRRQLHDRQPARPAGLRRPGP